MINSDYLSAREVFALSKVIPVLDTADLTLATKIVAAINKSGVSIVELALRHKNSLAILTSLIQDFPDMHIGVGTILHKEQLKQVQDLGARFAFAPAITHNLAAAAQEIAMPFIPAVTSVSDILLALDFGLDALKFFPAVLNGGVPMLQAWEGLNLGVVFCPTGGINQDNYQQFLALNSVSCVGGSWLIPKGNLGESSLSAITDNFLAV